MGSGFSSYGVSEDNLPRVVLFDGPNAWYEDFEEFPVEHLATVLETGLPRMWRMSKGFRGQIVWMLREFMRSVKWWDQQFVLQLGSAGHPVFVILCMGSILFLLYSWVNIFKNLF